VTASVPVGKYTRFDDTPDSTHNQLLLLVPRGSRVLELGCATGYMSKVLRERLGCTVTGIEVDSAAAEVAREWADRVIVGDAEELDYAQVFGSARFDVILFADVLEHLRDPESVLRRVRPFLEPRGSVVASIPNVAHGSVRVALLGGEFRYTPNGLLDDTHLRFFTQDSVLALFEDAGYSIVEWLSKTTPIDQTEVVQPEVALPQSVRQSLESDPTATAYQFIVRAARTEESVGFHSMRAELGALRAEVETREAAIRGLQRQLTEQTEAASDAAQQLEARDSTVRELRESLSERGALRAEIRAARRALREQSVHLATLTANLLSGAERQDMLERSLEDIRQALLSRADDLHSTLYDVRANQAEAGGSQLSDYQRLIRRVQDTVRRLVPRDATVVVVSRGDDALLSLYGRNGWHFPRRDDGTWAGEYPATSIGAIAQLESLRSIGADFLAFPKPALWWLEFYTQLKQYLDRRYQLVYQADDTCALYDIRRPTGVGVFEQTIAALRARIGAEPAILDWGTQQNLATSFPLMIVFEPPEPDRLTLPHLDSSVEIVALATTDPVLQAEARRVASAAVLTFSRSDQIDVSWLTDLSAGSRRSSVSASIVIPVYNNVGYTAACLKAVTETLPDDIDVQIVVVDDDSSDETPFMLRQAAERDARITVLRNQHNIGFIGSCNRGSEVATGEFLVFLNNDTLPIGDWLQSLLHVFRDRPDAGAVGGKLLYADGRLQEAGGIVFADGSAANFGRGEYDAEAPLFSFVREVDYCSGALLATPRALFQSLDGFDSRYSPAYYEDTDYCFALRNSGYRVYFQPASTIVHREGASSGIDVSRGVKRYQAINQKKFAEKWAPVLPQHPPRPAVFNTMTWYGLLRSPGVQA
jgi:GT2 family glycosyltransferase/2-polyprenyl-3-methyl-5-hydroxy-6-metoxy-1,4-benzoquinol methylase